MLTAAFGLLALAGWLRRDPSLVKGQSTWALAADPSLRITAGLGVEIVAFVSSLVAAVDRLAAGTSTPTLGGWWTTAGVGVILGAALLHILLVPRWQGGVAGLSGTGGDARCLCRLPAGLPAIDRF